MFTYIMYILLGYVSGSVLYGPIWARILHTGSITEKSKDRNPGTANAFTYGGPLCGTLTLICELLKGCIPIKLYISREQPNPFSDIMFALVLAAPVIGHIFPILNGFRGGKGITVTFGCLMGILPVYKPLLIMAFSFIFFSLILKITPHLYRTAAAYLTALPAMAVFSFRAGLPSICLGFAIITVAVSYKLFKSDEEREKLKVRVLWRH